jgi:transposase
VFWKPIYNTLEGRFTMLLVNARHLKQVPGRKSDVRDCQWIAQLLQYGLLKDSFIPSRSQRELRDLTRHRTQLVEEKARTANRIHKVLQDTNIKLSSVASDVLGTSGRAMLEALASWFRSLVDDWAACIFRRRASHDRQLALDLVQRHADQQPTYANGPGGLRSQVPRIDH